MSARFKIGLQKKNSITVLTFSVISNMTLDMTEILVIYCESFLANFEPALNFRIFEIAILNIFTVPCKICSIRMSSDEPSFFDML